MLRLPPHELYRCTPGEVFDMAAARAWVQQQQRPDGPMSPTDRARAQAKLDALVNERVGPRG